MMRISFRDLLAALALGIIPFEILQFSNATPSISCKRRVAGELAVDNMSADACR